ncbi:DUF4124 domain-containing protein [Dyella sp. BiH032]|uniref:DUF4124 domain-containing protein n=1 Tax=Dyella sp. BiH032 TaxID=3075430 RepID=UPI002892E806|nr:DUF4124 domain-containing protein [Dyella sp. BiH032]WNL46961.1 DUF4124 domain-containing protein [Dyella sp. BiH032]
MRLLLPASSLLLFLCLWLPPPAAAQAGVHRCIGQDGTPLFTDQPCAALQATPVQAPPKPGVPGSQQPATSLPPPILCAGTVAELRQSVADAFAARDPNRLAGLMLWGGYGRSAAVSDIRALGVLMQRPLLDFGEETAERPAPGTDPDAWPIPGTEHADRPPPTTEHQLVLHTASDDASGAPRETRFAIVRRSGCLWLRSAD